jgi:hypothetical protein
MLPRHPPANESFHVEGHIRCSCGLKHNVAVRAEERKIDGHSRLRVVKSYFNSARVDDQRAPNIAGRGSVAHGKRSQGTRARSNSGAHCSAAELWITKGMGTSATRGQESSNASRLMLTAARSCRSRIVICYTAGQKPRANGFTSALVSIENSAYNP